MQRIVVIAHNIRSTHNIGSLLRTCDGLGVEKLYFTGYSPYPQRDNDARLPHLAKKMNNQIAKTALGAEKTATWEPRNDIKKLITELKSQGYLIAALEQTADSQLLPTFKPPARLALVIGREVEGIEPEILKLCDQALEIPMLGAKESFNVTLAATMALYHCRYSFNPQ